MREFLYQNSVTKETGTIRAGTEESARKKLEKMNYTADAYLEWIGPKVPAVFGYCRISDASQNIERQVRNIQAEYPDAKIYQETYTGTTTSRPKWEQLQARLSPGDKIVFDSVSRMSRNAEEGFELYEDLYNRGIVLEFLKEPMINTETYKKAMSGKVTMTGTDIDYILEGVNKYMMSLAKVQIRLAFIQAQKEVDDLRQRTIEGLETARLNGVIIGRPRGSGSETQKAVKAKNVILECSRDFNGSFKDTEVMETAGVSLVTYYKYKKELREEGHGKKK